MISEDLVKSEDLKNKKKNIRYDLYQKSLSLYVTWINEQIDQSKKGYIRVKRGDLAIAMKKELAVIMGNKYKDRTFNSLFKIIRIILFNEGIFAEPALYESERVFILRKRKEQDILIPSLRNLEKSLR